MENEWKQTARNIVICLLSFVMYFILVWVFLRSVKEYTILRFVVKWLPMYLIIVVIVANRVTRKVEKMNVVGGMLYCVVLCLALQILSLFLGYILLNYIESSAGIISCIRACIDMMPALLIFPFVVTFGWLHGIIWGGVIKKLAIKK